MLPLRVLAILAALGQRKAALLMGLGGSAPRGLSSSHRASGPCRRAARRTNLHHSGTFDAKGRLATGVPFAAASFAVYPSPPPLGGGGGGAAAPRAGGIGQSCYRC